MTQYPMLLEPVNDASAWKGRDLANDTSWIYELSETALREIDDALANVKARGLSIPDITREDFPLPTFASELASLAREVESGRGFVVLRGLPVERYGEEDSTLIYWALCTYFGKIIAQNTRGELIGHVRDLGFKWGEQHGRELVRGYLTRECLPFHSDSSDRVGLLCLRKAKEGGLSSLVSSMALYNAILREHRELLPQLYDGFYYSLRGEQKPGVAPVTSRRIPVFSYYEGKLSAGYVRKGIEQGRVARGVPFSETEQKALDVIDMLANRDDLRLDMMLEPGDIQFCNNYTTFHSRTDFIDYDEPERKRHLLRIWLYVSDGRPLAPEFANRYGENSPYAKREAVVGAAA